MAWWSVPETASFRIDGAVYDCTVAIQGRWDCYGDTMTVGLPDMHCEDGYDWCAAEDYPISIDLAGSGTDDGHGSDDRGGYRSGDGFGYGSNDGTNPSGYYSDGGNNNDGWSDGIHDNDDGGTTAAGSHT